MYCYRVEHEDGLGIYRTNCVTISDLDEFISLVERHCGMPTPTRDPGIGHVFDEDYHVCAFRSIADLRKWIKEEELHLLVELGFSVYKVKLEEGFIEGDYQVVYDPRRIVKKLNITKNFKQWDVQ